MVMVGYCVYCFIHTSHIHDCRSVLFEIVAGSVLKWQRRQFMNWRICKCTWLMTVQVSKYTHVCVCVCVWAGGWEWGSRGDGLAGGLFVINFN